jgi:mevalonate kinase
LGLKSYLFLENRKDDLIKLILPDVGIERTWKLSEIPLRFEYPDSGT